MTAEKAGSRLVGIIVAAVVLLALLGLLIYLVWREQNPKSKAITQRSAAVQLIECQSAGLLHAAERLSCEINCRCFDAFMGSPLGRL